MSPTASRDGPANLVKLGGSVLTEKGDEPVLREDVVERLAGEVASAGAADGGAEGGLVLVHGAGSFGHPQAERAFAGDLDGPVADRLALAETHRWVATLNIALVEALHDRGVPAVTLSANALGRCRAGELVRFDTGPFETALDAGLVPVTHGDVVEDTDRGFAVVSGDRLMVELANDLRPGRALFVTDVDGLFDRDPRLHDDARLLETVSDPTQLAAGGASSGPDVTGGMGGKLAEMLEVARWADCRVLNGLVPGRLAEALKGGEVVGTRVQRPDRARGRTGDAEEHARDEAREEGR